MTPAQQQPPMPHTHHLPPGPRTLQYFGSGADVRIKLTAHGRQQLVRRELTAELPGA